MALNPGARLGPYEVLAAIGAGGMGEVYRARDTRLARDVAIKVLPAEFSQHPERLRRFEQEARAVSALNHPNILTIFDIGSHEGAPYVVFELLEGQTLREVGKPSQRKALEYAQQIALGLAAAHDKGITHRDLKPENLFVTSDGRLKILDFGLAKVSLADAATVSEGTQPGAVMGTAGYMSPEQVRGEAADHRTDIFSFGLILYEMLSGRRAFQAGTPASTMHAILTSEPPELEHVALDRIVRHCMEKSSAQRFQSARDIGFALEAASGTSSSGVLPAPARARRKLWPAIAIAAAVIAAAAGGYWLHSPRGETSNWTGTILPGPSVAMEPRVSPDGRTVAFLALVDHMMQVAVINHESGNWTVLTKDRTQGNAEALTWSADGSTIFYARMLDTPRGIYSIPSLGGEERLVLENAGRPEALPDGSLLVAKFNAQHQQQMHRYWPQSGRLDPLPAVLEEDGVMHIRAFSDGREAAFYGRPPDSNDTASHLYMIELASGRLRQLDTGLKMQPPLLALDSVHNRVLAAIKAGDLVEVISLPRAGNGSPRQVFPLTQSSLFGDIAPDGSLFLDQYQPGTEVLRFPVFGGMPEQLPGSGLSHVVIRPTHPLLLPDGRSLVAMPFAGRSRLLAVGPAKDPQPLIQTNEETSMPAAVIPGVQQGDQLAFVLGSGAQQAIAIASLADGRIIRRLPETSAGANLVRAGVLSLAASPDGRTLYYSASRTVWAVPVTGGQPARIASGDSVTVHPNGSKLLIKLNEAEPRLVWIPAAGGEPQPVPLHFPHGGMLSHHSLLPDSVFKDGRIVAAVNTPDFFFYQVAVIDPATGNVEKVPVQFQGDVIYPAWTSDGRIAALGRDISGAIWRFRPAIK
jgi:hypothetical protein